MNWTNWTKTKKITVPAKKGDVAQVNINEWFTSHPSFMLGRPVASQLRSATGNWAASCAVESDRDQDTIAILSDRLQQLLKVKGTTMSKITASKFALTSMYSFILEVTRGSDAIAIIHFPPDATWNDKFVGRIKAAGFTLSDGFWIANGDAAVTKARSWVKSCVNYGAFEMDIFSPSDDLPDIRRDVVDSLADRICNRISSLLEDVREMEDIGIELEDCRIELEDCRVEMEDCRVELEDCRKQLQERDAKIAALEEELANKSKDTSASDLEERLSFMLQLPSTVLAAIFDDTPDPVFFDEEPVFEDEEPVFEDEDEEPGLTAVVEEPEPSPEDEEEGFGDLDDLLRN